MTTLRLYNLNLTIDADFERELRRVATDRVGMPAATIHALRLVKRGLDARDKQPRWNCTADVELDDAAAEAVLRKLGSNAAVPESTPPLTLEPGTGALRGPVVVVGSGPAGGFAALTLALNGYQPVLLERGLDAPTRLRQIGRFNAKVVELDPENNTLFGEGGAGSFSDGKLYTSNRRDALLPRILETFVECGAPSRILTDAAPHVGTDILSKVVVNLRRMIEQLGGQVRFAAKVTDLRIESDALRGVVINGSESLDTSTLVLAPGHSARDTYEMLQRRGVTIESKPFQLGVRIEHPQDVIDRAQLGRYARDKRLVPASYDVACHPPGAPELFSFCMCPGGITMASVSEPGMLCTNGMSFSPQSSGYANSALVTTFNAADFGFAPLDGVEFQRRYEAMAFAAGGSDYSAPAQPVTHFLRGFSSPRPMRGTYARGRKYTALEPLLPPKLATALRAGLPLIERRIRGYLADNAILHAIESRASSPVRIPRHDDTRQSISTQGLYPAGEGAGFAGGIMSAALDGIRSAMALIARHARPA